MSTTFSTIVVPVDLDGHSDRSLEVAGSLATLGDVNVQIVTVLPLGYEPSSAGKLLERRASDQQLTNATCVVLLGNDPALAIAEHVATLDRPLVVIATNARNLFVELVSVSTASALLSHVRAPMLVIGPHVHEWRATSPTLLACVSTTDDRELTVSVMARWVNTFGGGPPWFLEVLPPADLPAPDSDLWESGLVHRRAKQLSERGMTSEWEVLHGNDPVEALERFADGMVDPVLVIESQRWTDPTRLHLHSVARKLAHHSVHPVLVLPHAIVPAST